jgi:hypothetical protein
VENVALCHLGVATGASDTCCAQEHEREAGARPQ